MAKNIENFRKEFFLENPTHVPLNNAGLCLLPKTAAKKLEESTYMLARDGASGFSKIFEEWDLSKKVLGQFLGANPSEIAWTPNCSSALSFVADGYEPKDGEEVVIFENEYPANFYPWMARAKRYGSQLKIVKAEADLSRPTEKIIAAITPKTRIVALSHIQSDCGYLMDISAIAEAAHKVGAILVVDVIQSAGIYPIDFHKMNVDILCGGLHKWLCAPAGAGFLMMKVELAKKIQPNLHGALNYGTFEDAPSLGKTPYEDLRRFEQGTPSFHSICAAIPSLQLLEEYSVDNLWKKSHELRKVLLEGVLELGFDTYGGTQTGPHLSITHKKHPIKQFSDALMKEKISHALRPAPTAEGKVLRLSPFAYNTVDEMKHAVATLKGAIA
jgi:selenocysteine lyase/cysteine desulfurase